MTQELLQFGQSGVVGTDVLSQANYAVWARRTLGFNAGIADRRELNKVWRQSAFAAAMLGTFTNGITAVDVLDDGNLSAFVTNFTNALKLLIGASVLYTAGGTANVKTITPAPAFTAYAAGQIFEVRAPGGANSGAVTLNVNGLGAKSVVNHDNTALVANQWLTGVIATLIYDGTNFVWLDGPAGPMPPALDSSSWLAPTAWVQGELSRLVGDARLFFFAQL